jgi:hypothetical protein
LKDGASAESRGSEAACYGLGVTIYRLRSFAPTRRIIAVQRFFAVDDDEAVSMATAMVAGSSFDLWEGERAVHGAAPTIRERKKPRR